ncbi:hypothetical protein BC826DRAFT_235326 [Russula brevipes]|nr:hypothetical protein BC826DRAFT_235326 [Russula brevipes]
MPHKLAAITSYLRKPCPSGNRTWARTVLLRFNSFNGFARDERHTFDIYVTSALVLGALSSDHGSPGARVAHGYCTVRVSISPVYPRALALVFHHITENAAHHYCTVFGPGEFWDAMMPSCSRRAESAPQLVWKCVQVERDKRDEPAQLHRSMRIADSSSVS